MYNLSKMLLLRLLLAKYGINKRQQTDLILLDSPNNSCSLVYTAWRLVCYQVTTWWLLTSVISNTIFPLPIGCLVSPGRRLCWPWSSPVASKRCTDLTIKKNKVSCRSTNPCPVQTCRWRWIHCLRLDWRHGDRQRKWEGLQLIWMALWPLSTIGALG